MTPINETFFTEANKFFQRYDDNISAITLFFDALLAIIPDDDAEIENLYKLFIDGIRFRKGYSEDDFRSAYDEFLSQVKRFLEMFDSNPSERTFEEYLQSSALAVISHPETDYEELAFNMYNVMEMITEMLAGVLGVAEEDPEDYYDAFGEAFAKRGISDEIKNTFFYTVSLAVELMNHFSNETEFKKETGLDIDEAMKICVINVITYTFLMYCLIRGRDIKTLRFTDGDSNPAR